MEKWIFSAIGCCGLLALAGCKVGSDESQQPTASTSSQTAATASLTGQLLKTTAISLANEPATTLAPARTETYYLVLHSLNMTGVRSGNAIEFQKSVKNSESSKVQLIWFEPRRKSDGSCLQDLSGYELEYGLQRDSYNTTLKFDLASPDMVCTAVGTTECGDVRECRYNLTL